MSFNFNEEIKTKSKANEAFASEEIFKCKNLNREAVCTESCINLPCIAKSRKFSVELNWTTIWRSIRECFALQQLSLAFMPFPKEMKEFHLNQIMFDLDSIHFGEVWLKFATRSCNCCCCFIVINSIALEKKTQDSKIKNYCHEIAWKDCKLSCIDWRIVENALSFLC